MPLVGSIGRRPTWGGGRTLCPIPERYVVLVIALVVDLVFGEPPPRLHPVVWLGKAIDRFDWLGWNGSRTQLARGAGASLCLLLATLVLSVAVSRAISMLPTPLRLPVEALLLKSTFSLRGLVDAADATSKALYIGDLDAARREVRALVSRDAEQLDRSLLASAAVESLAENLPDSVLAPLMYYALAGLPAAAVYRAANTLDAMVGYHGEFEFSGKVAARLDDALSVLPARLAACLIVPAAALAGGKPRAAASMLGRDRHLTESPNAGWPMSAMAGALGIRLEKRRHYQLAEEAPPADEAAIDHALQIVFVAVALGLPVLLGLAWIEEWRSGGQRGFEGQHGQPDG